MRARPLLACLILGAPLYAGLQTTTHQIHLGPIAPGETPYVYVPFEVPAGATEIVAELTYDRNGNGIDFAIFDARFSGRRDDLTGYRGKNPNRPPLISIVGRTSASPGHIAGPLPAGTWRIMFYVYRTVPAGVDVTLRLSIAAAIPTGRPAPTEPAAPEWLRGDLHVHTLHSDGTWTVTSAAAAAQQAGLDFLAITDHNTSSHHAEIDAMPSGGPLLLRGIEVTTAGGHMNAWGVPPGQMLEHRQLPGDIPGIAKMARQAHDIGAKISINHPFAICKACDWGFNKDAAGFDSIEVWNGSWEIEDEKALEWWDSLLRKGRRIAAIGSSDSHGPDGALGKPALHLYAQRNQASILDAIATARASITASPAQRVLLEASYDGKQAMVGQEIGIKTGSSVRLRIIAEGVPSGNAILYSSQGEVRRWPVTSSRFEQEIDAPEIDKQSSPGYFRLEVRDAAGKMSAMTNPIWVSAR